MRPAVPVLALVAASCGDPVAGSDYRGEPIFRFDGRITDQRPLKEQEPLLASVFWSLTGRTSTRAEELIEQPSVSVEVSFPATFHINIFGPPDAPGLEDVEGSWLIGQVLAYADNDGNHRFDEGELRGGAEVTALLYVREGLSADSSPTNRALSAGYNIVNMPLPCGQTSASAGAAMDNCGVALGAPCSRSADCGAGGECLFEVYDSVEFANGYCSLPYTRDGCVPRDGVPDPVGYSDRTGTTYWYLGCLSDADCREAEGYECSTWLGACLPKEPVYIDVYGDYYVAPLCLELQSAGGR